MLSLDKLVPADPLPVFASSDRPEEKKKIVREKEGLTSMVFSPLLPLTIMDPVIFSALKVPEG